MFRYSEMIILKKLTYYKTIIFQFSNHAGGRMRKAMFNRPITITLTKELYDKIKQKSDHLEISFSEWIRDMSEKELERLDKEK